MDDRPIVGYEFVALTYQAIKANELNVIKLSNRSELFNRITDLDV